MHHKITCNAALFAQALKDATVYTSKDVYADPTSHVLLTIKGRALAVIACDGHGYYERRLPLVNRTFSVCFCQSKPYAAFASREKRGFPAC